MPPGRERWRVGRDGQVRVLAAWSYQASKCHGTGNGSVPPTRQILVKVPCVNTNDGDGNHSARGAGAPYRLAWNDEVKTTPDGAAVRNIIADNSDNRAVDGGASTGHNDGGYVHDWAPAEAAARVSLANGNDIDQEQSSPAAAEHHTPSTPLGRTQTRGLTVQLPRPAEGDEASSTTPDGNGGCRHSGRFSGYSSLFSGSESRGWQSILEENKSNTSRVIANLRASVTCETRPSSARINSSSVASNTTPAAAAAEGPGLFPISVLEVRHGDAAFPGRTAYSSRVGPRDDYDIRPQSAAGSTTAGRSSRRMEGGGAGGGGRHHSVRTHLNCFADDVERGTVAATKGPRGGQRRVGTSNKPGNGQQNDSPRAKSARTFKAANRRRRDLRAQKEYSFFPSTPIENASEFDQLFDGMSGSTEPFLGGVTSRGDVSEWEGPICSNVDERSRFGYALDSPATWREAVRL